MENKTQQLQARVEVLEQQVRSLYQKSTLPYEVEKAFAARGFLQEATFIVAGNGEMSVTGNFTLVIPSATAQSIVLITQRAATSTMTAIMRASTTVTGKYELYAEGTAGDGFTYVVLNLKSIPYTSI